MIDLMKLMSMHLRTVLHLMLVLRRCWFCLDVQQSSCLIVNCWVLAGVQFNLSAWLLSAAALGNV